MYSITPNPLISRGKPIYASKGNPEVLVNGVYKDSWSGSDGDWVAINVGAGPEKVFFTYNSPSQSWSDIIASQNSCKKGDKLFTNYEILTSSNSTNGEDGDWEQVIQVTNNDVTTRAHEFDFNGDSWVKFNITTGNASLDEIECFDATNGTEDTWMFMGTSISEAAFKLTPPTTQFSHIINGKYHDFSPAMIRAGIPCITTPVMAQDIDKYLDRVSSTHYICIEAGTNDAWGGGTGNLSSFTEALQDMITAIKNAGKEPVIARVLATDTSRQDWQVNQAFLDAVDSLTEQNVLIPGPDLYTWFLNHPEELYDGVHPNSTGSLSMHQLWADAFDSMYAACSSIQPPYPYHIYRKQNTTVCVGSHKTIKLQTSSMGKASVFSILGQQITAFPVISGIENKCAIKPGIYIVQFKGETFRVSTY